MWDCKNHHPWFTGNTPVNTNQYVDGGGGGSDYLFLNKSTLLTHIQLVVYYKPPCPFLYNLASHSPVCICAQNCSILSVWLCTCLLNFIWLILDGSSSLSRSFWFLILLSRVGVSSLLSLGQIQLVIRLDPAQEDPTQPGAAWGTGNMQLCQAAHSFYSTLHSSPTCCSLLILLILAAEQLGICSKGSADNLGFPGRQRFAASGRQLDCKLWPRGAKCCQPVL